jgi:hypothetical protein
MWASSSNHLILRARTAELGLGGPKDFTFRKKPASAGDVPPSDEKNELCTASPLLRDAVLGFDGSLQ